MKKFLALFLAIVCAMSLASCVPPPLNSSGRPSSSSESDSVNSVDLSNPTIEETVLLDEKGVKITATSLNIDDSDPELGPTLSVNLKIENDTDSFIYAECVYASVNGYMVHPQYGSDSIDIDSGKTSQMKLEFPSELSAYNLKDLGISNITNMGFEFWIYTATPNPEGGSDLKELFINPAYCELKTSIYGLFEQPYDDSGTVLFEGNGVRIIGKDLIERYPPRGPEIMIYIENNTDTNIWVLTPNNQGFVNGMSVDATLQNVRVLPGSRAITSIILWKDTLESNNIFSIYDIFTLELPCIIQYNPYEAETNFVKEITLKMSF